MKEITGKIIFACCIIRYGTSSVTVRVSYVVAIVVKYGTAHFQVYITFHFLTYILRFCSKH